MKILVNSMLIITSVMFMSSITNAQTVVVVGANSSINAASKTDVVKVFLGKKKDLDGVKVVPIDQSEGSVQKKFFYDNTVNKSASQLKSYWARLIFTGKGQSPQDVGSDSDVMSMVSSNPNMIGYVDESVVNGSVKVIYRP